MLLPNTPAKKRRRDEEDGAPNGEPSTKKARVANGTSPSKARMLEEDGLVIVDAMDVVDVDAEVATASAGPEVIELD